MKMINMKIMTYQLTKMIINDQNKKLLKGLRLNTKVKKKI